MAVKFEAGVFTLRVPGTKFTIDVMPREERLNDDRTGRIYRNAPTGSKTHQCDPQEQCVQGVDFMLSVPAFTSHKSTTPAASHVVFPFSFLFEQVIEMCGPDRDINVLWVGSGWGTELFAIVCYMSNRRDQYRHLNSITFFMFDLGDYGQGM